VRGQLRFFQPAHVVLKCSKPGIGFHLRRRGLALSQMLAELTARGIQTPRGGQWSACAVRNVLLRLEAC
jgi:hypothetical protein